MIRGYDGRPARFGWKRPDSLPSLEGELTISVSAYILAGGMSRRFGENKALFDCQGKLLIQHVLNNLSPYFTSISIISKEPEAYLSLGYSVLRDVMIQQTPLVGILTGLEASDTDWNFFVACDLPLLTGNVFINLIRGVYSSTNSSVRAVVPVTKKGIQPLVGCYHKDLIGSLREAIARTRSVKSWLKNEDVTYFYFNEELPFRNINRREDLDAISIDG